MINLMDLPYTYVCTQILIYIIYIINIIYINYFLERKAYFLILLKC